MGSEAKSVEQRNVATPFAEDILRFFSGVANQQLSQATDLQRQLGTAISQYISSGGMPFDVTPQAKALEEVFAIDRRRGLADIAEQFGVAGSRFGTPIAVGSGRFLEGIMPRQEAVLGDLYLRAHEGAANRLLQSFGVGNQTAAAQMAPYLGLGSSGILAPVTAFSENPLISVGKTLAGLATGAGGLMTGLGAGGLGLFNTVQNAPTVDTSAAQAPTSGDSGLLPGSYWF